MRGLAALAAGIALIAGCAGAGPRTLHFGVEDAPEGGRLLWPRSPEVPRYLYAGQLVGEANFRDAPDTPGGAGGFFAWLAGLAVGERAPETLRRPQSGVVDARGRIYVSDTHAHDIKVFDAQGNLLSVIGRRGAGAGEFNYPTYLAFADGALYVTDTMNSRVQVISTDTGEVELRFGALGLYVGNLVRPKGVAVDRAGNIYVVESYYDHLLVFNRDGKFLMGIGGAGRDTGKFYLPAGVWVDGQDRVFVADTMNGRVVLFQYLGGDADAGR